jgi:hypothetical protein
MGVDEWWPPVEFRLIARIIERSSSLVRHLRIGRAGYRMSKSSRHKNRVLQKPAAIQRVFRVVILLLLVVSL